MLVLTRFSGIQKVLIKTICKIHVRDWTKKCDFIRNRTTTVNSNILDTYSIRFRKERK